MTLQGICAGQGIPEGLHSTVRTHTGETLEEHPVEKIHFVKDCVPWQGPHGEEQEEELAEMKHYELTTAPVPHSPTLLEGKRQKKQGRN